MIVDRLEAASEAFYVPLRMGEGLKKEAFEELCAVLGEARAEWAGLPVVPKRAANLFVDLPSAVESCSYLYPGEEAERVKVAADTIADLVRHSLEIPLGDGGRGRELFVFVPRSDVTKLPAGAVSWDVSSRARPPLVKLSPFYPHGLIPVPGMTGCFSDSVEGIWQGLKVIDGKIDESYFSGKGRKRRGTPEGHKFGERLLSYIEARRLIYVQSYEYMWSMCVGEDIRRFLFDRAQRGETQYFFDFESNGDVTDPSKPLAHSSVLVRLLAEEFDLRYGAMDHRED